MTFSLSLDQVSSDQIFNTEAKDLDNPWYRFEDKKIFGSTTKLLTGMLTAKGLEFRSYIVPRLDGMVRVFICFLSPSAFKKSDSMY